MALGISRVLGNLCGSSVGGVWDGASAGRAQDVLLGTTLRPADPQAALGWTATIDMPGRAAAVTLEMDSFLDEWRWTPPDGTATRSQQEPQPEFVVRRMKAAGIDVSKPGVQEEAQP